MVLEYRLPAQVFLYSKPSGIFILKMQLVQLLDTAWGSEDHFETLIDASFRSLVWMSVYSNFFWLVRSLFIPTGIAVSRVAAKTEKSGSIVRTAAFISLAQHLRLQRGGLEDGLKDCNYLENMSS